MPLIIDSSNINKYLKNTAPYIFVDYAEVVPGVSAKGIKLFTHNEWFFKCHYTDRPVVPEIFLVETLTQTASLAVASSFENQALSFYMRNFKDFSFFKNVEPGNYLNIQTEILSNRRGLVKIQGEASVFSFKTNKNELACQGSFQIIVPELINAFLPVEKEKLP